MKKLLVVIALLFSATVWTAEYKFIVPNAVGGGASDTTSRKLSQMYQERFGDTLTVMNVVGGQGLIAIDRFKQERLAVTIVISGQMAYNYLDDKIKITYKDQDFNIISPIGYTANILITGTNSNITNLDDFLKIKDPIVGSWQVGSDIAVKSLTNYTGQNSTLVRYRDPAFMITDLVSNRLLVAMTGTGSTATLEMVTAGKLKIIGSSAPFDFKFNGVTIPSIGKKYNIPQFDYLIWLAITPGNTPEHIALAKNLKLLIDTKEFQDYIKEITIFPVPKENIPPNDSPATLRNHVLKYRYLQEEIKEVR